MVFDLLCMFKIPFEKVSSFLDIVKKSSDKCLKHSSKLFDVVEHNFMQDDETKTRFTSAMIFGFVVMSSLFVGGWMFNILILAFTVIIFQEWIKMIHKIKEASDHHYKYWFVGGMIYAIVPLSAMINIRYMNGGLHILLWYFFVIWAADCGGYFVGRRFGGKKLAPTISPGKTVSGAAGGIISAFLVGMFFIFIVKPTKLGELGVVGLGIIAVMLAVFSQISDLFESYLKRKFDIKDTGNIIPGHGGLMDRLDSLTLSAPFLLFILS